MPPVQPQGFPMGPNIGGESNGAMRAPTFGEKAVGLTFNPSADKDVDSCKRAYAAIIDALNKTRGDGSAVMSGDKARLISIAITEAQSAQMWAVKAITWRDS